MHRIPERNRLAIEEFRANGGAVGGPFAGIPVLLLHTIDPHTGAEWVHPLTYRARGAAWVVVASTSGADTNPSWFDNLVHDRPVTIEVGSETVTAGVRILDGAERDEVWAEQKRHNSRLAHYEQLTSRSIPVIEFTRMPA